jgi:hypothetical protein
MSLVHCTTYTSFVKRKMLEGSHHLQVYQGGAAARDSLYSHPYSSMQEELDATLDLEEEGLLQADGNARRVAKPPLVSPLAVRTGNRRHAWDTFVPGHACHG